MLSIVIAYAGIGLMVLGVLGEHVPKLSGLFYAGIFLSLVI